MYYKKAFSGLTQTCIHWVHCPLVPKDVGFRIRVDRALRERFVRACQDEDKPAAQVIREFMRKYVARRSPGKSRVQKTDTKEN